METGLEGKPWYQGLGIGLTVGLVLFALYHFKLSEGQREKIEAADAKKADLEQKISEGQAAEKRLPQFQDQVAKLEAELKKLLRILPKRKNTQELIRRLRQLTEQAGFSLRVFDPAENLTDRDFYRVWDIKIDLLGGYHELAGFFDKISRISRIINIENLRMTANRSQGAHTLTARFNAKTFVEKEEPPPGAAPAKKSTGGKKAPPRGRPR